MSDTQAGETGSSREGTASLPPDEEPRLLPEGNRARYARGGVVLVAGSLVAFVLMAITPQLRLGVPLGGFAIFVAAIGALDLLGTFDDGEQRVSHRTHVARLAKPLALLAGGALGLWASICAAVSGHFTSLERLVGIPAIASMAVVIPACFLLATVGLYRAGDELGVWEPNPDGTRKRLRDRHGFWLVSLATALYLPLLGSHSLSDPWETHYGEVAREILARNDWISTWWAQDGWFWSKPVLDMWMQALAMATFGVRYAPGEMMGAVADGRIPWPEWAVRLPIFLLTVLAVYLLYKAVAKVFGRRAGFLGGAALLTMPQWAMLSHQTVTDMPFVATMSAAMALLLLAMQTDPNEEVRLYEVDVFGIRLRLSAYHLVFAAIVVCALPQILYLASRNVEIRGNPFGIYFHADAFTSGSPGNCGIPGNEACRPFAPVLRGLHPFLQALIWAQALALLLFVNWGERRLRRITLIAAWFFAALATLAKGPVGIGLPVLCVLVYVVVSRRYKDLLDIELASGVLIVLTVAFPWFVAMYARHGQPFTDRLLFHDMFSRAFGHVHDTNDGDDVSFRYYVWQLGYATFPWTGLLPAALVAWLRRREGTAKADASAFFGVWFILGFALFSAIRTKFHHYIFPVVPAAGVLVGLLLEDLLAAPSDVDDNRKRYARAILGASALSGALLVFFVGRDLLAPMKAQAGAIRFLQLFTYNYKRPWPPSLDFKRELWVATVCAAVVTGALLVPRLRRVLVPLLTGLAAVFTLWTLDVYLVRTSPHWGQRETMIAYYQAAREKPGPLVAYQMNWKGENFYTGNRLPAFVSSGKKFQEYILETKRKGTKTFYFMTEPNRTTTLANEINNPRVFTKLTTPELNNKFVLVQATFE